jgi:high-affinity iron transporter
MFAAALIVFRETLEAALFVGIIAAATKQLPQRGRWRIGVPSSRQRRLLRLP